MMSRSTLCHPDTVSGITIAEDGTKVYWTEGYSVCRIVQTNGSIEEKDAHDQSLAWLEDFGEMREMTTEEVAQYDTIMGR